MSSVHFLGFQISVLDALSNKINRERSRTMVATEKDWKAKAKPKNVGSENEKTKFRYKDMCVCVLFWFWIWSIFDKSTAIWYKEPVQYVVICQSKLQEQCVLRKNEPVWPYSIRSSFVWVTYTKTFTEILLSSTYWSSHNFSLILRSDLRCEKFQCYDIYL